MSLSQNARYFRNSKGQLKIQQMAFVLVATMIFFAIVGLFYFSIRFSSLKEDVGDLRRDEVIETVRKLSGSPEFSFGSWEDCAACVDFDKVMALKERNSYQNFWQDVSLLQVIRVYPEYGSEECTAGNYPNCNKITLTEKEDYESYEAFVSLCRYDGGIGFSRCELGKIVMGFESVENG